MGKKPGNLPLGTISETETISQNMKQLQISNILGHLGLRFQLRLYIFNLHRPSKKKYTWSYNF